MIQDHSDIELDYRQGKKISLPPARERNISLWHFGYIYEKRSDQRWENGKEKERKKEDR
jgi:hypothetical protein